MISLFKSSLFFSLLALAACQPEPELNCERVRFGWPDFLQLDPSVDISSAEGIQIDIRVRSDLLPGAKATLSIAEGDSDKVSVGETRADQEGGLLYEQVTVPTGPVIFYIDAEDDCGKARTGRRAFVWDGLGEPQCALSLLGGADSELGSARFLLHSQHDQDEGMAGMQVQIVVEVGRPDIQVALYALDRETGAEQVFELSAESLGRADQELTLGEGEQAIRAICYWPSQDLRLTSPTQVYFVDSSI